MKTRPTSRDIAYAAGVSQATVSRALRDSPLVRPETRARILEIAREMNYRVDRSAAGLRTRQSRTLAVLLFEDVTADESHINPFFLALLSSITRAAAAREYDVLVSFQQLSRDWVARYEISNRADGIILLGYGDFVQFSERLRSLLEAEAHFVIWGPHPKRPGMRAVGCDNFSGGQHAARHLLSLDRRKLAFIGTHSDISPEFRSRFDGFRDVIEEAGVAGLEQRCLPADSRVESGHAAMHELLRSGTSVDGVFAASDLIAIGVCQALREAGRKVPQDVSVIGFDDIPAAAYTTPPLTTIRQDTVRAGEQLVDSLIAAIHGDDPACTLLQPSLIIRGSCGAVSA